MPDSNTLNLEAMTDQERTYFIIGTHNSLAEQLVPYKGQYVVVNLITREFIVGRSSSDILDELKSLEKPWAPEYASFAQIGDDGKYRIPGRIDSPS